MTYPPIWYISTLGDVWNRWRKFGADLGIAVFAFHPGDLDQMAQKLFGSTLS